MEFVRNKAEMEAQDGQMVRALGTYGIANWGRHRVVFRRPDGSIAHTHLTAVLKLDDGTYIDVGVRSEEEMEALEHIRVVVTGRLRGIVRPMTHDHAQRLPWPEFLEVQSIEEWKGEQ